MENDQNIAPVSTPSFLQKYKNIFISVALLIVIVASGWFVFSSFLKEADILRTQNLTVSDETAGWKTYRNEEYGFEIKLPPGWIAKIDDYFKSPVFISAETNKTAEENCKPGGRCNPEIPAFDIFFNNLDSQYKDYIEPSKIVEIGNNKWTRYLGDGLLAPTHYILINNGKVFNFGAVSGSDESVLKEMLLTFKTIEPQTSDVEGSETFQYKDIKLTYEERSDRILNIIYSRLGASEILIQDLVRNIYTDKQLIFYKTELPNIVRIKNGVGDAGLYVVQEYYVDLDTKKYFSMSYSDEQKIHIKNFDGKTYTINLVTEGECIEIPREENGKIVAYTLEGSVNLVGIEVNGQSKYQINPVVVQKCGVPDFNPWDLIVSKGLSKNLDKVFFYYTLHYKDTDTEIENYFSFDLKTQQIQKEDPVDMLFRDL
jgi:hypothetical protein